MVSGYNIMRFSQSVVRRYGLQTSNFSSLKDVEDRIDRAINGLEYEIYLK